MINKKQGMVFMISILLVIGSISFLTHAHQEQSIYSTRKTVTTKDISNKITVNPPMKSRARVRAVNHKTYNKVVMIYMVGSDLESENEFGIEDIKEMINANFGKDNLIVIQTGGSNKWHSINGHRISSNKLQRYIIENGKLKLIENLKNNNMGKAEVLNDFILFTQKNYAAKESSLILWSHGSGPALGFGSDQNYNDDALTLEELKAAFQKTKPLDSIVFDACLMGSIETAYALSDYAKYMIASSETSPGSGLNYKTFLETIQSKPINHLTVNDLNSFSTEPYETLSIIDLSKIKKLMKAVSKEIKSASPSEIHEAARKAIAYGVEKEEDLYSDLFDLKTILLTLNKDSKAARLLEKTVLANLKSNGFNKSSGLSVYIPMKDEIIATQDAPDSMDDLDLPKGYLKHILKTQKYISATTELNVPKKTYEEDFINDTCSPYEECENSFSDLDFSNIIDSEEAIDLIDDEISNLFSDFTDEELLQFLDELSLQYGSDEKKQSIINYLYFICFGIDDTPTVVNTNNFSSECSNDDCSICNH